VTEVIELARLFEIVGSGNEEVTRALLFKVPAATGMTATDTMALPTLFICPKSQRTTWPTAQVPWLALAEATIEFPENVPAKLTSDTVFGPAF
jgi:hypothetical protein